MHEAIDQAAIDLQRQLDRDLLDHETTKNLCEAFLDEFYTVESEKLKQSAPQNREVL